MKLTRIQVRVGSDAARRVNPWHVPSLSTEFLVAVKAKPPGAGLCILTAMTCNCDKDVYVQDPEHHFETCPTKVLVVMLEGEGYHVLCTEQDLDNVLEKEDLSPGEATYILDAKNALAERKGLGAATPQGGSLPG